MAETDKGVWMHEQAYPASQCHGYLSMAQGLAGLVQGDQRGRAGGIHRHGWAMQVKNIGKTVGCDTEGIPGHGIRRHAGQIIQGMLAIIHPGDADIDTAPASGQRGRLYPGILHGLIGHFQQ